MSVFTEPQQHNGYDRGTLGTGRALCWRCFELAGAVTEIREEWKCREVSEVGREACCCGLQASEFEPSDSTTTLTNVSLRNWVTSKQFMTECAATKRTGKLEDSGRYISIRMHTNYMVVVGIISLILNVIV